MQINTLHAAYILPEKKELRAESGPRAYLICMERDSIAPDAATLRQCAICKQAKLYTIEHWPNSQGVAYGAICRLCARDRKRLSDRKARQTRVAARTQYSATLAGTVVTGPALPGTVSTAKDKLKDELPLRQLEVAKALRLGAARLNESAGGILETILEYAANSQSPHHEWALRLVAERVIPKKLYEDLGSQAAGIKAGQGTVRPAVTIIVQPASPAAGEPVVKVVEGESSRIPSDKE